MIIDIENLKKIEKQQSLRNEFERGDCRLDCELKVR
jgi:hypothetical protein